METAPDRLAPAVTGPMAWEGSELDPADYVVKLNDSEIREVRIAVISFKCT